MYSRDPSSSSVSLVHSLSPLRRCVIISCEHASALTPIKGRYDAALRDYKKGKFLLETRPGQILPVGPRDVQGSSAESQQKKILNKVWGTVEKVMGEMKNQLLAKLQEPTRGVDEQEKTIESVQVHYIECIFDFLPRILLELNPSDDPVWTYLDAQHKYILNHMQEIYLASVEHIRCRRARGWPAKITDPCAAVHDAALPIIRSPDTLPGILAGQLQTCIAAIEAKQGDVVIGVSDRLNPVYCSHPESIYDVQRKLGQRRCGQLFWPWSRTSRRSC